MDNRTVEERAMAESSAYAAAARRVGELERQLDATHQQIAALEDESRIIAEHIASYHFQLSGPVSQATLKKKLDNANAAAASANVRLAEVTKQLDAARTEHDQALQEFLTAQAA